MPKIKPPTIGRLLSISKVTNRLTTAISSKRCRGQLMGVGGKKRSLPIRRISHRRGKRSKNGALSGVRKRMNGKRKRRINHSNREIWLQMGRSTVINFCGDGVSDGRVPAPQSCRKFRSPACGKNPAPEGNRPRAWPASLPARCRLSLYIST